MSNGQELTLMIDGTDMMINEETSYFKYHESMLGAGAFQMRILSPGREGWQKWDELLTTGQSPKLKLRWMDGEWKSVIADDLIYTYLPDGIDVLVRGVGAGVVLGERCHQNRFHDMLISEMVSEIAEQNGFEHDVAETKRKFSKYQCTMSDGEFVKDDLLIDAVSNGGFGDYRFYIKDGVTLVFKPPELSSNNNLVDLTVLGDIGSDNNIQQLSIHYRRGLSSYEGHSAFLMRGFDLTKKKGAEFLANDSTVKFKKLASRAPSPPDVPGQIGISSELEFGEATPGVLEISATGRWSRSARSLYRTSVELAPLPLAELGQTVNLTVRQLDGTSHPTSGKWLVFEIENSRIIDKKDQSSFTKLGLERRTLA